MSFQSDLFWIWHDWQYYIEASIVLLIMAVYYVARVRGHSNSNEPVTTVDESDKSGLVHIHEIAKEQEGASFLIFERSNGDIENRQIEQPFTFYMEDNTIERHHINPRGSYKCVNPAYLFLNYKPSIRQLNKIANLTEQHIRHLRTGGYNTDKAQSHIRMFLILFALAGMIGLGLAAATIHH